jgi:hypothetical protein
MPMAHHVQTSFSHSKSDQMQMQTQALNMVIEDDKLHEERASLQAASPAQLVVWWTCLVSEMVLLAWIIHVHPV